MPLPKKKVAFRPLTRGRLFCFNPMHGVHMNMYLRFHNVPMFSRGTIRCFTDDILDMKKLAGWDFEDILQVNPFTTIFLSPNCSISTTTTVYYPCLWRPSAQGSQRHCAGPPVQTHNMACISKTPNSHWQDAQPACGFDKDPYKCNATVPPGDMRSFSYQGTPKGGWGMWTTCGSVCIEGEQLHSNGWN